MTLSNDERKLLLEFIKSKYVDYYDIRLLIAKDLEENIVKQMEEDNDMTFDMALNNAYQSYGVVGFSNISDTYMKQIRKHFFKLVLKRVKLEISRLTFWIYVSLFFIATYLLLMFFEVNPFIFAGVLLVILLSGFLYMLTIFHKQIKALKEKDKYYYLDEMLLSNNSVLFPAIYAPLALSTNLHWSAIDLVVSKALLALATTISLAAIYLIVFNVYRRRASIIFTYEIEYLSEKTGFNHNLT